MAEGDTKAWEGAAAWVSARVAGGAAGGAARELGEVSAAGLGPLLEALAMQEVESRALAPGAARFRAALEDGKVGEAVADAARTHQPLQDLFAALDEAALRCPGPQDEHGAWGADAGGARRRLETTFNNAYLLGDSHVLKLFRQAMYRFLGAHFRVQHRARRAEAAGRIHTAAELEDDEEEASQPDEGDEEEAAADERIVAEASFDELAAQVAQLGWFFVLEEPLSDIMCCEIEKHIAKVCKDEFEERLLARVCHWQEVVALRWLRMVLRACFAGQSGGETQQEQKFEQSKARLEFHVFETLCALRMSELFDVITEYPDSCPALEDLKECLARTHQYRELVQGLRRAFATRLLHPGANTAQILDVYISAIKALRLLDPSGVLLEAISEPIKRYLCTREDTVRCIVTSLTDDSNSELFEELGRGGDIKPITQSYDESDDEGEEGEESGARLEEWIPDPIEADPRKTSRSRRSNDILSILVHIYGSKELFVNEYRLMLADKLLCSLDVDMEREVRNLELLKLRFGEGSMLQCEIMIKDMEDSKRINANIKTTLSNNRRGEQGVEEEGHGAAQVDNMEVTIVSKQFWPTLHGDEIELHPAVKKRMSSISHEYSVLKNPRQLVWKSNLGQVQLDLEFDDGKNKTFVVAPLLATLIMHVSERESWAPAELAAVSGLDEATLHKRMAFWVNQGVVRVTKDCGVVQSYSAVNSLADDQHDAVGVQEDDGADRAVSADAQLAEEMQVYEDFVRGMLNNYDALPLERIHNMLKMFVSTGEHKYDKTEQQLGAFLDQLVRDEVLSCSAGNYQLVKR